ncbi:MAG: hypothetical protein JWL61_4051 [Gemmatimonadetes bacterium]|nr:hypothetical protein [Gemmatimonadota bacterium]
MPRPRKRISVREALRLRKRARELERRLNDVLTGGYPGPIVMRTVLGDVKRAEVETANKLGFALVARYNGVDTIALHAVRDAL